jgi:hypothetical protein
MMHFPPPNLVRPLLLACTLPILLLLGGCQVVGAIVAKTQGPEKILAMYVPKKVPTLILSEHAAGAAVDDVSSQDIGRRVADTWADQKLSPLIDLSKLEEFHLRRLDTYDKMSMVAIGKALGAQQVLYIDVRDNHDESAGGSDTIRARASVRVRMIDVATGQTLWPPDAAEGFALDAETQFQSRGEGVSESTQFEQVRAMIADKIVKLFYTHLPDTDESVGGGVPG